MQNQFLTAPFLAAVQRGEQMKILAVPLQANGASTGINLDVTDGTITFDYTAATRRTCTLTISDPTRSLIPELATDTLAPYGQSIKVYMGPISTNLVPMGVFNITEVDADDQGTIFTVTVNGADVSAKISREALTQVYNIAAGTNYATAIKTLIDSRFAGLTYNFASTTYTTPAIVLDVNQDPWAAALQMATSIGMDLFFDRNGVCTMRPTPDPTQVAPSWIYSDTNLGYGIMMDELQKAVVADGTVYNNIIVSGETSDTTTTYSGNAYDSNPASPTYVNGPFGDIPIFYKSSILTSNAQAQSLANAKLIYYLGRSDQISVQGPPNPAQDEEDVVQVVRSALSINAYYTIDKCAFSIAPAGENTTQDGGVTGTASSGQQTLTMRKVIQGL
jgi:hypothetical protein